MEVFVARQPIFTKKKDIFAYELLYRNNPVNQFPDINGDVATTDVIINSFINIGIEDLSNGKPCFINFTEKLLNLKLPTYFKANEVVIEILESVPVNLELIHICKDLKSRGYQIALDDFILNTDNPYYAPLLKFADIIKVDFRSTSEQMRSHIEIASQKFNIKLLAEKIETEKEFELAIKHGYQYFQGYYFSKPLILSTRDVPEYFQNFFILLNHLSNSEPDLAYITQLIEQDLSLTYKLLKLINSPAYRPVNKINSIRQAIVRLGFEELKKWICILTIRGNMAEKNGWVKEIFSNCLIRAKMCEHLALYQNKRKEASAYFLTGMFSLMDVLLGMQMGDVLKLMPLQDNICEALNGISNLMKESLDLCIAFEKGSWEEVSSWCKKSQMEEEVACHFYKDALKWSSSLMEN